MDYAALKTELDDPKYKGWSDQEIATAFVEKSISPWRDVPVGEIHGYLLTEGLTYSLSVWLQTAEPSAVKASVFSLMELLTSPNISVVRMSDATTRARMLGMLGAMIGTGGFTSEHRDTLLALSVQGGKGEKISLAEQFGFNLASVDMVQEIAAARKWS